MNQKILILGYTSYNFKDENGVTRKGCKITYLTNRKIKEENKIGYLPIVQNMDLSWFPKLDGPGVYNAQIEMISQGGRGKLDITDLELIEQIDLAEYFN